jgi:hypothetical protein
MLRIYMISVIQLMELRLEKMNVEDGVDVMTMKDTGLRIMVMMIEMIK